MDSPGEARLLVFDAEGRRYACTLASVREIVPFRTPTRLPGAPSSVLGLINLRGRLVTIVDLAAQLGTREPGTAAPAESTIVLLGSGERTLGVVVDVVRDVRPVAAEAMEPLEGTDGGAARGAVRALARLDDGVAVVIDTEAMIGDVLQ